jgi:hypothetical protein
MTMIRRTVAPTVAGLAAVVALAVACTTGAPAPTAVPRPSEAQKPAATPGSSPAPVGDVEDLLVLRMAAPAAHAAYAVIEPGSGRSMLEIGDGVISHDWHTLASVAVGNGSTKVELTTPEGGSMPTAISVPGAWRVPTVGIAKVANGLSADGSVLVLEEAVDRAPASLTSTTRFAIVATIGSRPARIVTLAGSFAFDVLSPDGRWLYLLEYLPGGDPTHYQVRRLDVMTGQLQDGTIVDKRNIDEQMHGYALAQVAGRGGMVFTLYRGPEGAFIHALDTHNGGAFCIDLPGTEDEGPDTNGDWGIVADPSGSVLYVTDPAERRVSVISLTDFSITRSATIAMLPTIQFAKLETAKPAGGRAALSPDGKSLYVITKAGVALVRTADLVTTGHFGGSGIFRSIAAGSAGAVYAVDDAGHAVVLASGSGASTQIGNGTYSSIVALVPYH